MIFPATPFVASSIWLGPISGTTFSASFNAAFASGPKTAPATVLATCVISDIVFITCPTALVTGALPIAAALSMNLPAAKLTAALLQEHDPLMQEVDCMVLELATFGHEQSEAFLHILGTCRPGALFALRACSSRLEPVYFCIAIGALVAVLPAGDFEGAVAGGLEGAFAGALTGALEEALAGALTGALEGAFAGALTGALEGALAGALTGALEGALTGALAGALAGALTGALEGALAGALTGALAGAFAGALTGALAGVLVGVLTGALTGVLTGVLTGALAARAKITPSSSLLSIKG